MISTFRLRQQIIRKFFFKISLFFINPSVNINVLNRFLTKRNNCGSMIINITSIIISFNFNSSSSSSFFLLLLHLFFQRKQTKTRNEREKRLDCLLFHRCSFVFLLVECQRSISPFRINSFVKIHEDRILRFDISIKLTFHVSMSS